MTFGKLKLRDDEVGPLNAAAEGERKTTKEVSLGISLKNPRSFAGITGFNVDGNTNVMDIGIHVEKAVEDGAIVQFSARGPTKVNSLEAVVIAYEETGFQNVLPPPAMAVPEGGEFATGSGDRAFEVKRTMGSPDRNYISFFAYNRLSFDITQKVRVYEVSQINDNELDLVFSTRYPPRSSLLQELPSMPITE